MTRSRIPPGPVLQRAYGVLDQYKISRTFFVKTDQEGCALAASDINAANGINPESTVAEATGIQQKKLPILGNDTPEKVNSPVPFKGYKKKVQTSPVVSALRSGILMEGESDGLDTEGKSENPSTEEVINQSTTTEQGITLK